jgi:hypothetical protein
VKTKIKACPSCGQKNRVPKKYRGIAVCGSCREQMFPTTLRLKRKRWNHRDWHLVFPILLLAYPIYWALNHDWSWLWDQTIGWVTTVSVNVTIVSAIALAWLIVALSLKVSWEEWWAAKQQRHYHPPGEDPAFIDLGAWEAARDYIYLFRTKVWDTLRNWRDA